MRLWPWFTRIHFRHSLPCHTHKKKPIFALIHKDRPPDYNCPPGFKLADVDPGTEFQAVAAFIQSCYLDMQMDKDIVTTWTEHPVYDPQLWVWVMDTERGVPAVSGLPSVIRRFRKPLLSGSRSCHPIGAGEWERRLSVNYYGEFRAGWISQRYPAGWTTPPIQSGFIAIAALPGQMCGGCWSVK